MLGEVTTEQRSGPERGSPSGSLRATYGFRSYGDPVREVVGEAGSSPCLHPCCSSLCWRSRQGSALGSRGRSARIVLSSCMVPSGSIGAVHQAPGVTCHYLLTRFRPGQLPGASVGGPVRRGFRGRWGRADDRCPVAQIRNSRKKSLPVIAGLAGMSKSRLSEIGRGECALDSISEIGPWLARSRSSRAS
jgi:hypothetical protein